MYRFIRDHNKKFMAIFAVVLMVAFLVPAGLTAGGNRPDNAARAFMGDKEPITIGDFQRANNAWELLMREVTTRPQLGPGSPELPLLFTIGDPSPERLMMIARGMDPRQFPGIPPAPIEIIGNPTTFLLLVKEAQAAGITITDQRVDDFLNGGNVQMRPNLSPAARAQVREAVRDFLLVEASYARVASAVKSSDAMRQHFLVSQLARVDADVVSFDALPIALPTATTAPTATTSATTGPSAADKLQAQFDKYADVAPGTVTPTNPFGFGYRIPDRVKLQTLAITRDQLKAAVERTRKPRQWDVEARKYFLLNPSEFPAPTTAPTTLPGSGAGFDLGATAAATAPTTGPTTRTFDALTAEQKKQAMDAVMRPEIDALSARIAVYLNDRFTRDYGAVKPATRPSLVTTAPAAEGYTSYTYLESVAADVQKEFGALPTVADHANWLDATAVALLPGIGIANLPSGAGFDQAVFAAQPLTGEEHATPKLYEFSQALRDFGDSVYYFRVTDAQRAHRPASIEEVRSQVVSDVARQEATDAAEAAAKALVAEATTKGFTPAATATGRPVAKVGPLQLQNQYAPILGIEIPESDHETFRRGIGTLLSSSTRDPQDRPLGTITLPNARKVLAVNITTATIEGGPAGDDNFVNQIAAGIVSQTQLSAGVMADWFSFEGVSKRIKYEGEAPDRARM